MNETPLTPPLGRLGALPPRRTLRHTLEQILRLIGGTIDYDRGAIHLVVRATGELVIAALHARRGTIDPALATIRIPLGSGFSGWVAETGEPFLSGDIDTETRLRPLNRTVSTNSSLKAYLGVPLRDIDGQVIGVLELVSERAHHFSERDLGLAQALANQATLAIENAQLVAETTAVRDYYGSVLDSVNELVFTVARDLRITGVNGRWRQFGGRIGPTEVDGDPTGRHLLDFFNDADRVAWAGVCEQLLTTGGVNGQPLYQTDFAAEGNGETQYFTMTATPLRDSTGDIIGLTFSTRNITERTRLDQELRAHVADLTALQTAALAIADPDTLRVTLTTIAAEAAELLSVETVCLILVDPDDATLRVHAAYGLAAEGLMNIEIPIDRSLSGWVVRAGQSLLVNDADADPRTYHASLAAGAGRNVMIAPVRSRGQIIGTLNAHNRRDGSQFTNRHLQVFATFALSAGIAIENARLLDAARQQTAVISRQLAQQRALHEIGTQINAELSLDRVLQVILDRVRHVFDADGLVIFLRPPGGYGFRPVASLGLSAAYIDGLQQHYLSGPPGIAISHRLPVIIEDTATDPRMGPLAPYSLTEGIRTVVQLPCVYRDEVLGFLGLYHRLVRRYTDTEQALLRTFADQAAVAIKNAQLHESVVDSATRLDTAIEALSEPLVACDSTDRILLANKPFYSLLGFDPARFRIEGLTIAEAVTINRRFEERLTLPTLDEVVGPGQGRARPERLEIELRDPWRCYQVVESALTGADGSRQGRLIVYHDVTSLRESQRLKDELVSVLSHELRTPLTSILGYAKLLADRPGADPDRRQKWANFILDKSRLLSRLIDEVLDLSRLSMQRFILHRQSTDLVGLVHRIAEEMSVTTDTHQLHVTAPAGIPPLMLDQDRIGQVLTNILHNAIKYWPEGGVIQINIALTDSPNGADNDRNGVPHPSSHVRVSITDHGPGIAAEHHDRIFEPFYRVDHDTARRAYGTGLGLAVSKGIVEAHGGKIRVLSPPDGGSTFVFTLPLEPAPTREPMEAS